MNSRQVPKSRTQQIDNRQIENSREKQYQQRCITWEKIRVPSIVGGLGVRKTQESNATQSKMLTQFSNILVKFNFLHRVNFFEAKEKWQCSCIWSNIRRSKDISLKKV